MTAQAADAPAGIRGTWEYIDISALAGKPPGTLIVFAVLNPKDAFDFRDGVRVARRALAEGAVNHAEDL